MKKWTIARAGTTALLPALCAIAGAAAVAGPAKATATGDAAPTGDTTDIVVTARKRVETVQTIPQSLRAIGEKELDRLGADSLQGFASQVPGLTLTGTATNTQIVMRGVTTGPVNHDQSEIKETVGLYLDETPISVQRYSPNLQLYDLSRVEVLRGPQGTLYGAGSMAGAVRLITNKPDPTKVEASARAQAVSVDHGGIGGAINGMVNLPIVADTLAVRLVGSYRDTPGFIDNVTLHEKNVDKQEVTSGRAAIRYTPGPDTTIDGLVVYEHNIQPAYSQYTAEAGYPRTTLAAKNAYRDKDLIVSLTVNQQFEAFNLTATGAYMKKRLSYLLEVDGFPNLVAGSATGLSAINANFSKQRNYNGEFRLASKDSARVQWTLGAFYQNSHNDYGQDVPVPGFDRLLGIDSTAFAAPVDNLYRSRIALGEKQFALFGEAAVQIVGGLKLTAGGRYFRATQTADLFFAGLLSYPSIGASQYRHKDNGFNPRVNLTYEFNRDHLVYAQAAKGFRLGGTNEPVPVPACSADLAGRGLATAPTGFKSDSLWNYEIGSKNSFFDRKLTINASIYHIDWRNPQVTAQLTCGFNVFVNAGGLRINGGELETIFQPSPALTIRGGLGRIQSQLTGDLIFVGGHAGDNAPYVPKWTFNASADYRRPIGTGLTGFAFVNYANTGARDTKFNASLGNNYHLRAYAVLGARIGIEASRWSAALFAQNLTDSRGTIDEGYNRYSLIPATFVTPITPRTIGIEVTLRY